MAQNNLTKKYKYNIIYIKQLKNKKYKKTKILELLRLYNNFK